MILLIHPAILNFSLFMNINPLANKKPARRFLVLTLIVAAAIAVAYITSKVILKSQQKEFPVEAVDEFN
jgi:hypothetical protein